MLTVRFWPLRAGLGDLSSDCSRESCLSDNWMTGSTRPKAVTCCYSSLNELQASSHYRWRWVWQNDSSEALLRSIRRPALRTRRYLLPGTCSSYPSAAIGQRPAVSGRSFTELMGAGRYILAAVGPTIVDPSRQDHRARHSRIDTAFKSDCPSLQTPEKSATSRMEVLLPHAK